MNGGCNNVNNFLLGFCDPLGINNGHPLSSNFQIYIYPYVNVGQKHRDVFLAKTHFVIQEQKKHSIH